MEEELRKQLDEVGIKNEFKKQSDDSYLILLSNENEWGRIFSLFEASSLQSNDEDSELTLLDSKYIYFSKEFVYELLADFQDDVYKLIIKKSK